MPIEIPKSDARIDWTEEVFAAELIIWGFVKGLTLLGTYFSLEVQI